MANIKILLADDHKIVRDGIKLMLNLQAGIEVAAEAGNGKQVLEKLENIHRYCGDGYKYA